MARMSARYQAEAKASDDARKARFRAHVERPQPPMTEADRGTLAQAQTACLAIRHIFPPQHPQHSMSFLGGEPLTPEDFDYPMIHNREGLLEPLTFMAQIDLSTLPDGPGRALLPSQGYLYFFAPMSGRFDDQAYHFVVRYVAGKAKKNWGPHGSLLQEPIEGAEARYRYPWMNWRDKPEKFYPRSYPRTEIALGWIDDSAEVEEGDADAAGGFPWEVAKQRRQAQLVAFHGAPVPYDPVLSANQKPDDELWIPFEGFPTNGRAAEIVLGFLKTYLKEETTAIEARLAALSADTAGDAPVEKERLETLLKDYRDFEQAHWRAMHYLNGSHKPLSDELKTLILGLLENVRAGAMPQPFVKRTYIQKRLPLVLNEWLSVAAVESVERALRDPEEINLIPPSIVEAVRYNHSVLKDPRFSEKGEYAQHQMLGRGDVIQVAADEMALEHILLLQLSPDTAMGWHMGDSGALQYWIHPADLAAQRFENTILTFECH